MEVHPDSTPAKANSFHLEAKALFQAILAPQGYAAPGRHHPMPWQPLSPLQRPDGQPRRSGMSRRGRHLAIGDDPPARHLSDHATKPI